jgi:hypothetical protein
VALKLDFKSLNLDALKNFNWRSLQKFTNPKATADLNAFLEKLPSHAGQTVLIIAGIAWVLAGGIGLYTTVQMRQLTELRNELKEAQALQPIVPTIKDVAVNPQEVTQFVDRMAKTYGMLSIKASGSSILITAENTASFGQFREAIAHVQNGGSGWRVSIDRLCVGRECEREPLAASLKINKVSVENPADG